MKNTLITISKTRSFEQYLTEQEKSQATIRKYMHDLRAFAKYADGRPIGKVLLLSYKEQLEKEYSPSSANSMLAALNSFLRFCGHPELCVKPLRVQKEIFRRSEKELTRDEYRRLVATAEREQNQRLSLLLQTICGTGIRVSELPYITAEAVIAGTARVSCKGKSRTVFIVAALQRKLKRYMQKQGIHAGAVFVTKTGKPLNRSNIWKEMKSLCAQAHVSPGKVFPHNLRHLFARTFYGLEKDIAKLADILGHTSINTTRIYIITTGEEHRRRMESMRLIL